KGPDGIDKDQARQTLAYVLMQEYRYIELTITPTPIPVQLDADGKTATAEIDVNLRGRESEGAAWQEVSPKYGAGREFKLFFRKEGRTWRVVKLELGGK